MADNAAPTITTSETGGVTRAVVTPTTTAPAETKAGDSQSGTTTTDNKSTATSQAQAPTVDQATKAVQAAGLDMASLSREYAENGQLSEQSLKALKDKGISQDQVNQYVEGQKAVAEKIGRDAAEVVGGEENLNTMLAWAKANLSASEIKAYNKAVLSGDADMLKLAVAGVNARYSAATGSEGTLVNAAARPNITGVTPFKSTAEITRAMSDPKYKTDPAYRAEVAKRLDVSNVQNVRLY